MDNVYYCPDCQESFTSNTGYKSHVTDKLICYRCLRTFSTKRTLGLHLKKNDKCEDKRITYSKNVKAIKKVESKAEETTTEIEKLRKQLEQLQETVDHQNKTIQKYKNQGLNAMEKMLGQTKPINQEPENTLTIRSQYNPIIGNIAGHTGYTSEVWTQQIIGDNTNKLLEAEFGKDEVDNIDDLMKNAEKHDPEYEYATNRQSQSNSNTWTKGINGGFMSNKFNQNLEYNPNDFDNDEWGDKFDENFGDIHVQNSKRRQKNRTELDIDIDFHEILKNSNLRIEGVSNIDSNGIINIDD